MRTEPAEILRDALSLPTEARSALVDSLLESPDVEVDDNVHEAWREEIHRRLQKIGSGADGPRNYPWMRWIGSSIGFPLTPRNFHRPISEPAGPYSEIPLFRFLP